MAIGNVRSPSGRNSTSHNRAAGPKVLLCALALGTLLASLATAQVLDGIILLPDSLGPLYGKDHVAFDEDSAHPRIFIGGEGGDVIAANALTCERVARIRSGPMNALCYIRTHNKLYVSTTDEYGVAIVDCNSYEVVKRLPFSSLVTGLHYNPVNDRVYCATDPLKTIDCTIDSVVDSLPMNATDAKCALDGTRNKLYVSAKDSLRVVDCNRDSVVACLFGLRGAQAICFQPTAGKMYVAAGESLFALLTESDSIVHRHRYDTLDAQLGCDPAHNRVYYTYWSFAVALDCNSDSTIWTHYLSTRANGLAVVPSLDKLHVTKYGMGMSDDQILDGSSGQGIRALPLSDRECLPYYCAAAKRVFLAADNFEVLAADCDADSICGGILLSVEPYNMCIDSVHNKLCFCIPYAGARGYVGVVDCASNKVTKYLTEFNHPSCLEYNHVDNKLYVCSYDSCIFVYDCANDTVIRILHTDGRTVSMCTHPDLNKLYAVASSARGPSDSATLHVIDLVSNTELKTVGLPCVPGSSFLAPELNQFWVFYGSYTVVDCLNDSIVMDTMPPWYCGQTSPYYSPSERSVYVVSDYGSGGDSVMYVINMDTKLTVDSIPVPTRWSSVWLGGAARSHKAYWVFCEGIRFIPDSVFVIDTRSNSIAGSFTVPVMTRSTLNDCSGDYVYFLSDSIITLDTRIDSMVNRIALPLGPLTMSKNNATNRFYFAGSSDTIQVVYDSVVVGVQESRETTSAPARLQSVVCRILPFRCAAPSNLYDASGRHVTDLRAGANDITPLAPGVYFVRRQPPALDRRPQVARKVVITE